MPISPQSLPQDIADDAWNQQRHDDPGQRGDDPVALVSCPRAIQLIEGHANPLLFAPYDVAGPVHIVGLDDQFESVGDVERAENFKRSPGRRQASYGAADGSAAAEPNRSRLQNTPSRCPAVFVHGGSIGVEPEISINPAIREGPLMVR